YAAQSTYTGIGYRIGVPAPAAPPRTLPDGCASSVLVPAVRAAVDATRISPPAIIRLRFCAVRSLLSFVAGVTTVPPVPAAVQARACTSSNRAEPAVKAVVSTAAEICTHRMRARFVPAP